MTNITLVVASAYDPLVVSHSVDRFFIVAVLAEIPDDQMAL